MTLHAATCPLDCPDACGVLVETDPAGRFLGIRGNPEHPHSKGSLCGKTAIFDAVVTSPERLTTPLLRTRAGGFEPVSWERAIEVIAERVKPLAGDDVLALYYAGNMGLVSRRFPMRVLNRLGAIETDGTVCDDTPTAGYEMVLGRVVGPRLDEVEECDLLVLWGCDARRTLQHFMPAVRAACKRGARVIVIDVYRTDTMRAVERWGGTGLIVHPGSDAALALGLCALAFAEGAADQDFLAEACVGAESLRAAVEGAWPLERIGAVTGLAADDVRAFADALFAARAPFLKTGIGWARRRNGGMNMRAVCSLAAVLGHADRLHYESFGHFDLADHLLTRDDLRPAGASTEKVSQVGLGAELAAGRFKACIVWGHNPAVTLPDSNRVRAGLAREDLFLVVHELFLTETARMADVVLPATTFVEHTDVLRSYGHRVLHLSRKACDAPADQRSNVDAFRALAGALGLADLAHVTEEQLALELLAGSRGRFTGGEYERLLAGEPVDLAPTARADRGTPSGKVELESAAAAHLGQPAVATYVPDDGEPGEGRFRLHPAPSIATHNSTYTHSSRHAARAGRGACFMHPADAAELGVEDGDAVRLRNARGSVTLPVRATEDVPRGLVRVDGFPDEDGIPEGVGINALTTPDQSDLAGGHSLYSARVDVERAD